MKKINIYYYNPNYEPDYVEKTTVLSPLPGYLDTWTRHTAPEIYSSIEWVDIETRIKSQDEIATACNNLKVDILCITAFVWSMPDVKLILDNIKKKLTKNTLIIVGGPEVGKFSISKILTELPEIDFVVFGQGENAFVSILKHALDIQHINLLNAKNIAWLANGIPRICDFEFIRRDLSPYLDAEHLLAMQQKKYPNSHYDVTYAISKGCVYKCAFCDWQGGGLTYKMHSRKNTFVKELEMFAKLGIFQLRLIDSNIGMFDQDIEFAKYLANTKKENGWNWKMTGQNFAKLHKDNVYKIMSILTEAKIIDYPKISLQALDTTMLENIERPDISWKEHKPYIVEFAKSLPTESHIRIELIFGIPGNTREKYRAALGECAQLSAIVQGYQFDILINAKASTVEWKNKFQVETAPVSSFGYPATETIVACYSFNQLDFVYFKVLTELYNILLEEFKLSTDELIEIINVTASDSYESIYSDLTHNMELRDHELRICAASEKLIRKITVAKSLSNSTQQAILNGYKEQFKKAQAIRAAEPSSAAIGKIAAIA
jgi:tRNA A37 methylthiotransferase MiaB